MPKETIKKHLRSCIYNALIDKSELYMVVKKNIKKTVSRKGKKPVRKTISKKAKPVPKHVKKDIKSLKKGLRKEMTLTKKVSSKTKGNAKALELLRKEIELLKNKKKRVGLSDYQRFMKIQIKKGLSFKQAAKLWTKQKKQLAKKNKKRTAYNIFISMQLKQGKTMKQAIVAWNRLKNPPKKRKRPVKKKPVRKKPVKKRVVKRKTVKRKTVKRKPVKRKLVKRTLVKKRVLGSSISRPRTIVRQSFPEGRLAGLVEAAVKRVRSEETKKARISKETILRKTVSGSVSVFGDEELALKMIDVYFSEVARHGLKRKLTLDEVVNSYFYTLTRIQRKDVELSATKEMIGRQN